MSAIKQTMKIIYSFSLFLCVFICVACGDKGSAEAASVAENARAYNKIKGVTSYKRTFGDLNDLHLSSAIKKGIKPLEDRVEAEKERNRLLRVVPNGYFTMDSLTHSVPYLVPSASVLLTKIASNFQDSLQAKGLSLNRIIVTSVLRTKYDVKRLRRRNVNASLNSAHFYGTTFDVSYRRFEKVNEEDRDVNPDKLKMVLAEVLRDLRKKEWCYIKYEVKQGCFHITTRL